MRQRLREARKTESGFTLIELLIVIVILGVLSAVVVIAVGAFNDRGETAACQADYKAAEVAVEAYRAKTNEYPPAGDAGWDALIAAEFLRSKPETGVQLLENGVLQADCVEPSATDTPGGGTNDPVGLPTVTTGATTENSASVNWSPGAGGTPTGYDLRYATTDPPTGDGSDVGDVTSYELTGLTPSTTYYVQVRAKNDAGPGDWSTVASFTTGTPSLPDPAGQAGTPNLGTIGATPTQWVVPLSWSAPSSGGVPASYEVRIKNDSGGNSCNNGNTTTTVATGITGTSTSINLSNSDRCISVRAVNANPAAGEWSGWRHFDAPDNDPGTPTGLTVNSSEVASWNPGGGGPTGGYDVQRGTATSFGGNWSCFNPSNQTTVANDQPSTSFSFTGLTNGTRYCVRVRGVNPEGEGNYTSWVMFQA